MAALDVVSLLGKAKERQTFHRRMDAMLPDTVTKCCPHLAHLCGYATCGSKHIMLVAEARKTDTDNLPDDLKPYGEALTKFSMEVLTRTYIECLMRISEQAIQEITRAATPPTHHTEPDSLQRSGSDEI